MKREDNFETTTFENALSDVFQDDPEGGAFGSFDDLSRRRMVNDILTLAANAPATRFGEPLRKGNAYLWRIGVAAAVLCTLGAALFAGFRHSEAKIPSQPVYFGEVQAVGGALYFDERPVGVNAPIPVTEPIRSEKGPALLRLPTGITWQLGDHGRGEIASLSSKRLQVTVAAGESWFRVDPKRSGPAFSVNTSMGRIDVTGTIFVVNVDPSEVRVTLLRGSVWVTRTDGKREKVETGYVLHLREAKQQALSAETSRRMTDRLRALAWMEDASAATPIAVLDVEREHLSNLGVTKGASGPTREEPTRPDARQLLKEIQAQRKQRNWGRVASLYNKLIRQAPSSETAVVSRVSLGEVYLTKLQQYKEALAQFDSYLQSGHTALLPEASFGRCNAFRSLRRRDQEIQCLDGFLKQFENSFQAPDARARLQTLRNHGHI